MGFKADSIYRCIDYKGNAHTYYKKTVGTSTYHCLSLSDLERSVKGHTPINQSGASDWYGKGRYNGD